MSRRQMLGDRAVSEAREGARMSGDAPASMQVSTVWLVVRTSTPWCTRAWGTL